MIVTRVVAIAVVVASIGCGEARGKPISASTAEAERKAVDVSRVPCDGAMASVPFGKRVAASESFVVNDGVERVDLTGAMPALDALDLRLWAVTGVQIEDDPSRRLVFVAPRNATQDREAHGELTSISQALASCVDGEGWRLTTPPMHVGGDARIEIVDVARIDLPRVGPAVSVTEGVMTVDGSYQHDVLVIGRGTPALPVIEPRGAGAREGILLRVPAVARGFRSGDDYKQRFQLRASGWYPLGSKLAYLEVSHEDDDVARMELRAVVGPEGAELRDRAAVQSIAWVLVASGRIPLTCASVQVRCAPLEGDHLHLAEPFTWMAGVWEDASEAKAGRDRLGVAPKDARWIAVSAHDRPPDHGPDGARPLASIKLTPPLPPPPPPARPP